MLGMLLAAVIVFPFTTLIEQKLGLPYLRPPLSELLLLALSSGLATVIIGSAASCLAAVRLSRVDAGTVLREGN